METPFAANSLRTTANAAPSGMYPEPEALNSTFAGWAAREVERLLTEREQALSEPERADIDLRLAMLCDAAQRYGRSLAEVSEY